MNGTWYKKLHKEKHFSKEERKEHRHMYGLPQAVRVRLVVKTIRKLWKMFTKAPWYGGDHCVFWYDVSDGGGYRECCDLLGGKCCGGECPYTLLEKMREQINELKNE